MSCCVTLEVLISSREHAPLVIAIMAVARALLPWVPNAPVVANLFEENFKDCVYSQKDPREKDVQRVLGSLRKSRTHDHRCRWIVDMFWKKQSS